MHLAVLAFIGVRSYKHTIYCATKLVFPYVFSFVFRIARDRTVWVAAIFTAWLQPRRGSCFLVLSVTRRRPPLGQFLVGTLNHENCNVSWPKAFETLIHQNVTRIVFVIVCEIYSLTVYRSIRFEAKERAWACKDYVIGREITTALKIAVDSVKHELCDSRDYFPSSLLVNCSIRSKTICQNCKDYVIGREITTVLKIAVESVTLELCDSRDHFASSLLVKKTD